MTTPENDDAGSGCPATTCSPLLDWEHRRRRNAYGGEWEVHHPDGTKHLLFLGRHKGLGFYAIQAWGYETAKLCKYRRLAKPAAKRRAILHVSEANAKGEASPD